MQSPSPSLRIAINATPLLSPLTGIGNYIAELGAALAATGAIDVHSFYGFRWRHEFPQALPRGSGAIAARRLRDVVKPWIPFKRELRQAQQRVSFRHGLRRDRIDVYHEPNYVPVSYDVPVVTTVHDLSWLHFPDAHPVDRVRWLEKGLPRALEASAAILVDSAFVRDEVLATFGVPAERVTVTHLGVGPKFHPRSAQETAAVLATWGLGHQQYVLTVGTIEPRKNLGHALEAYSLLPNALRARFPLVVAGAKGWRSAALEARLDELSRQGQIRFLGHVPADDLPVLYAGAMAFVFPSIYEGFGLTPLEAMASGVPVLASDRGSLAEVVGEAGVRLDPERPELTAELLSGLLEDPAQRQGLIVAGLARSRRFTWEACAAVTLAAYRSAAA